MGRSWGELCSQLGHHAHYADGTARPKYRGWLHGVVTVIAIPSVLTFCVAGWIPSAAVSPIAAICITLVCSSTLHLYPFIAVSSWEVARRLDRFCILLVNATSYFSPQLTSLPSCKPPLWISIAAVVVPNAIGAVFALKGAQGPTVFIGAGIAAVPTTIFWASYDLLLATYSSTALLMYGIGLAIHTMQPAQPAKLWGHHEWTHVLITIGLVLNALGVIHLGNTCT